MTIALARCRRPVAIETWVKALLAVPVVMPTNKLLVISEQKSQELVKAIPTATYD